MFDSLISCELIYFSRINCAFSPNMDGFPSVETESCRRKYFFLYVITFWLGKPFLYFIATGGGGGGGESGENYLMKVERECTRQNAEVKENCSVKII